MLEPKTSILIVISNDLFVRNYLQTNALSKLEERFDCNYIAHSTVSIRKELESKKNFRGYYSYDAQVMQDHYELFNLMMWKYRNKSTSFQYRIARTNPHLGGVRDQLDNETIFEAYKKYLIHKIPPNAELENMITSVKPEIVLFPSSAYDPDGNDVVRICSKHSVKSMFLVDNWDNLSSKSVLWSKPDYTGFWGEQSKMHAISIQDLAPSSVRCIGTPRFDSYFKERNMNLPPHFDFPYILFLGTALTYNEESVLYKLNSIIETNSSYFGNVKVIYRPHPWRQSSVTIRESYGARILTDPQILEYQDDIHPSSATHFQPKLSYYPSLLSNAEFIMGGLTSMIIESLIFYKNYLTLVHDDGENLTNQRNAWNYYIHFQGLERLQEVKLCHHLENLEKNIISCWLDRNAIDKETLDAKRRWFFHDDSKSYCERLLDFVTHSIDS